MQDNGYQVNVQFSSGYRAEQFIPCRIVVTEQMGSSAVFTKFTVFTEPIVEDNVYRVIKVNKGLSVHRVNKVIIEVSFHQVTEYLPSLQWLPSSKIL